MKIWDFDSTELQIKRYKELLQREKESESVSVEHLCEVVGAEYNSDIKVIPQETMSLLTPSMEGFVEILPRLSRLVKAEGSVKKRAWYFCMNNDEILKIGVIGFFKQCYHHILWRAFIEFEFGRTSSLILR